MSHVKIVRIDGCVSEIRQSEQWRTGGGGSLGFNPPSPEILKALQNRTKLDPIVKTYLRTNSDFCFLHYQMFGFYNRGGKCLQRGTDWFFI